MLKETRWEYAAMISGNTDTEHFAALYFTMLGDIKEFYSAKHMARTLAKAIKKVQDIQIRVLGCEVANEMNFCISRSLVLFGPRSIYPNPNPRSQWRSPCCHPLEEQPTTARGI